MSWRKSAIVVLLASSLASPGVAHARDESRAGEIADRLNDPVTQYMVAGFLTAMAETMLDMNVAPLVDAMEQAGVEPRKDLPRDARVRDLAGPGADDVRGEIIENVPRAMSRMGAMAGAFDKMMPELEDAARRMKDAIPQYR